MSAAVRTGRIFHDARPRVVAAGLPERWFASAIERPGRVIDRHTPSPYNPLWFERGKRFGGRRRIRDAGCVAMDGDKTLLRVELESDSESVGSGSRAGGLTSSPAT